MQLRRHRCGSDLGRSAILMNRRIGPRSLAGNRRSSLRNSNKSRAIRVRLCSMDLGMPVYSLQYEHYPPIGEPVGGRAAMLSRR